MNQERSNVEQASWGKQIGAIVLCIVVIGGGAWWLSGPRGKGPAPVAPAPQQAMQVDVMTVRPQGVPIVLNYLGQTEAFQKVEIRARVAAFLEQRLFEEGALVRQDQQLFRLESAPLEAELQAAKASLAQAEARRVQAQRQVDRFRQLVAGDAASQRELEDWQTNYSVAVADVQSAQAKIRQAELNLSYTQIHSPLGGMIGKAGKDVGSYVNPQTDGPLAVVQQLDPMYVEFPISERDLLRWHELAGNGQQQHEVDVQVTLANGKPYRHTGKLGFMDVRVEPRTGTARMRAEIPNPELELRPGQLLRVQVTGLHRQNVLTVPQAAVIQAPTGSIVYTVDEKNTVQPTPVTLGDWVNDLWIVEKGLEAGQRVVVNHLLQVRPGMAVRVNDSVAVSQAPAGR